MMPGAGSARGDWANQAAEPPRSFARIIGVQTAARSCAEERVALMGGCTSVHRSFALFRGSARAGAVIPNEQIISGLRPIPRGALPSGTPTPPLLHPGGIPIRLSGIPYPARASRSSPAPGRGRGQSWRYPVESRIRFSSGISPWSGPWGYRHGGRGPGRGKPPPRRRVPVRSSSKSPPPPFGGAVRGDTQGKTVSRDTNPRAV